MNSDPESKRGAWPVYATAIAVVLPVLYFLGFGPVVRLAMNSTEDNTVVLSLYSLYTPILELADDNPCQQAFVWSLKLWFPEGVGLVIPMYSSDPSSRAPELIYSSDSVREIPEIWEKFCLDSQKTESEEDADSPTRSGG